MPMQYIWKGEQTDSVVFKSYIITMLPFLFLALVDNINRYQKSRPVFVPMEKLGRISD